MVETRVDPRAEDDGVERLREVVVGADFDAPNDALRLVDGGDHDHRHVTRTRCRLEPLEDCDPVELGHDDVEKHDVDGLLGEQLERLHSVCRGVYRVPVLLEEASKQLPADAVVVGDEDRVRHLPSIVTGRGDRVNLLRAAWKGIREALWSAPAVRT